MDGEKPKRSFLAKLTIADGSISLSFKEDKGQNFLIASTLVERSIMVYFQPNGDDYLMFYKGLEDRDFTIGDVKNSVEDEGCALSNAYDLDELDAFDPRLELPGVGEQIYIGVGLSGRVLKTTDKGIAYRAQIIRKDKKEFLIDYEDPQYVYLKSWRSKQFMQVSKREVIKLGYAAQSPEWFSYLTDCDGSDALLRLTVHAIWNAEGTVLEKIVGF